MYNFKQDGTQESRENPIHGLKRKIKQLTAVAQAAKDWHADANRDTRRALHVAVRDLLELERGEV